MDKLGDDIIYKAAAGDCEAIAMIYKFLKEYTAGLSNLQREQLEIEKNNIISKGMQYRMKNEQLEVWRLLIEKLVNQIQSENEILNIH